MARTRVKFRLRAFEEIRRSPDVVNELERRARAISLRAGDGYEASVQQGRTRARASVITTTAEARLENARRNTLLRALDAGRS